MEGLIEKKKKDRKAATEILEVIRQTDWREGRMKGRMNIEK